MKAIQTANKGGNSRFSNNYYIKLLSNINRTGLFSAFTFILLALTCLFPISKGEQSTEAVTGTAQSSSLTLSVTGDTASVELDVNSTDGTFASSTADNSAAFSVVTNNFSGYTLSISGSDNEGKLYDITKQNALSSLTVATTEATFSSSTGLNGKWGYKPSKFNSIANNNYLPAPTTTASTLDTTSVANTTANDYSISLGLRADYTTTADTYSNSFIITAVPNPIAYVITYDANTTDTVSNMPASQNSTTSATEITLSDKTPAREGYDFKGWCTTAPTTTNPDTCTGTTFQPGGTYGIDQTSENITVLYAIWKKQIIYIQDYSYAQCSTEAVDAPATVVDKRDNKEYTVRYINGICTMTQNLDFELTTGMTFSPDTTNVTASRTLGTVGSLTTNDDAGSYNQVRTARNTGVPGAGLHYNYAAATAGTIMGGWSTTEVTEATEDICPAGWRLPTGGQNQEQFILNNSYTWQQWNSNFPTAFAPVAAGYYYSGSLYGSGSFGNWWSSTAYNTASRYYLLYKTSNGLSSGDDYSRVRGFSVRCVKAKPGVTISFNANGGTGTMDMQKIDAGQSANLTANTFTRTDYVFTGWNTKPDGSGTSYANAATYTAPASEDNKIVVLYAQWAEISLQNYAKALCQAEASSAPVELTDSRDGKVYRVRYINGICTMIDNLDLELTTGMTLSPETTNVTTTRTLGTVGSLTTNDNDGSYNQVRTARNTNVTGAGLHYNYAAATAGTIMGDSNIAEATGGLRPSSVSGTIIGDVNTTEATEDICPAGWRLPTGNSTGEQFLINNSYSFGSWNANYPKEFNPVAAGFYNSGSLYNSGSGGYWWSSTARSTTSRYNLSYYTSNGLYSGSTTSRYDGLSVRCVLK